jgi:hypothetical protein
MIRLSQFDKKQQNLQQYYQQQILEYSRLLQAEKMNDPTVEKGQAYKVYKNFMNDTNIDTYTKKAFTNQARAISDRFIFDKDKAYKNKITQKTMSSNFNSAYALKLLMFGGLSDASGNLNPSIKSMEDFNNKQNQLIDKIKNFDNKQRKEFGYFDPGIPNYAIVKAIEPYIHNLGWSAAKKFKVNPSK